MKKVIKKAMNGMGPGPKKKSSYLISSTGDTLRGKAADVERKRMEEYGKWVGTESPFAKEAAAKKKTTGAPAPKKKMKTGGKLTTAKGGKQMMKRADGSTSPRGLWDNIRAAAKRNKAAGKAGKKPTAAMLKQERKIKAKGK